MAVAYRQWPSTHFWVEGDTDKGQRNGGVAAAQRGFYHPMMQDNLPSGFLITGNTNSTRFTGEFFGITMGVHSATAGQVAQVKTTYNLLTRALPLGINISTSPTQNIIDPKVGLLLSIVPQIIQIKLGMLFGVVPTGLQQDFPWRRVVRIVGAVVCTAAAVVCFATPGGFVPGVAFGIFAAILWRGVLRDFGAFE